MMHMQIFRKKTRLHSTMRDATRSDSDHGRRVGEQLGLEPAPGLDETTVLLRMRAQESRRVLHSGMETLVSIVDARERRRERRATVGPPSPGALWPTEPADAHTFAARREGADQLSTPTRQRDRQTHRQTDGRTDAPRRSTRTWSRRSSRARTTRWRTWRSRSTRTRRT